MRADSSTSSSATAPWRCSGWRRPKAEACRQALTASAAIIADLALLSEDLAGEIPAPLRVAIGIHAGPAIVGAMGYGGVMGVTAIGDTVNIASRLGVGGQGIRCVNRHFRRRGNAVGHRMSSFETREISIRGSTRPHNVRVVPQAASFRALAVETRGDGTSLTAQWINCAAGAVAWGGGVARPLSRGEQGSRRPLVGDQPVDQPARDGRQDAGQLPLAHGQRDHQRASRATASAPTTPGRW